MRVLARRTAFTAGRSGKYWGRAAQFPERVFVVRHHANPLPFALASQSNSHAPAECAAATFRLPGLTTALARGVVRLPWPSVGRNLGTVGWRVDRGCSGFEQIDGGYAHQSEDPARHRRAACGGAWRRGAWRRCLAGVRVWCGHPDPTSSAFRVPGVRVVRNKHIVATTLSVHL